MTQGGSQLTGGRGADGTGISKNVNHGGSQPTFYIFRFTALPTTGEMSSDVFIFFSTFYFHSGDFTLRLADENLPLLIIK